MRTTLKRGLAGAMALSAVASLAPIIAASPAAALATNNVPPGTINVTGNTSGGATTTFSLALTEGSGGSPTCPGDGPAGYRWSTFIIPASSSVSQLVFSPTGAVNAVAGEFRNNLYQGTSAVRGRNPDITSATITGIPGMQYNIYDSTIPAGAYQIGIACHTTGGTLNDVYDYWSKTVTIDQTGGVMSWAVGATPSAPTVAATGGDLTVSGTVTPAANDDPAPTSYTVTLTPAGANPAPGGPVVVTAPASGVFSAAAVDGVQYGNYDVTATSTNSVGTSVASAPVNVTVSPDARPAVTGFDSSVAGDEATFTWTTPTGPAPTGYSLVITPASGPVITVALPAGATSHTESGLAVGNYTAVITPLHPSPFVGTPSGAEAFTIFPNSILVQDITVTRPVGALVLTQVCGAYGALAAEPAQLGFPGGLPAEAAVNSSTVETPTTGGTAPTETSGGSDSDPVFGEYPYPANPDGTANATYPTYCGIDLGDAQFVRSGAGAGQFFAADGRINQVTVVDTRDGDLGWNVVGQVSDFDGGPGKSFSGSQLGWTPVNTEDTGPFSDSLGNTYDQFTVAGAAIAQNSPVGTEDPATVANGYDGGDATGGLTFNRTLVKSPGFNPTGPASSTGGLGTAIADARLKLLIPITAQSGVYTATLTISTL